MTHIFVGDYLRKLFEINFSLGKIWTRAHVLKQDKKWPLWVM